MAVENEENDLTWDRLSEIWKKNRQNVKINILEQGYPFQTNQRIIAR